MPQTCPHCGIALTGVIDAFCPECREDLSATPEEAQKTAEGTFNAVTGIGSPEKERTENAVKAITFTILATMGLIVGVIEENWEQAIVAGVVAVACAFWVFSLYQDHTIKTSVTGHEKTTKSPEQPQ